MSLVCLMCTGKTRPLQDALCSGLRQSILKALLPSHLRDGKILRAVFRSCTGTRVSLMSLVADRLSWLACRIWRSLALGSLGCHPCLRTTHRKGGRPVPGTAAPGHKLGGVSPKLTEKGK